jgi:hypothetical protein
MVLEDSLRFDRNGAQISLPGMMMGTDNLNVSLTMNFYPSFSGMLDLSLSDLVLLFAGKVFSLACWVALDELPGSVETLVAFVDNGGRGYALLRVHSQSATKTAQRTNTHDFEGSRNIKARFGCQHTFIQTLKYFLKP